MKWRIVERKTQKVLETFEATPSTLFDNVPEKYQTDEYVIKGDN